MVILNILSKTRRINKLHFKTIPEACNWQEATRARTIKKIHLKNWPTRPVIMGWLLLPPHPPVLTLKVLYLQLNWSGSNQPWRVAAMKDSMSAFLTDPRLDTGPPAPSALLHPERRNKALLHAQQAVSFLESCSWTGVGWGQVRTGVFTSLDTALMEQAASHICLAL